LGWVALALERARFFAVGGTKVFGLCTHVFPYDPDPSLKLHVQGIGSWNHSEELLKARKDGHYLAGGPYLTGMLCKREENYRNFATALRLPPLTNSPNFPVS
jgi:hypothetical protein